MTLQRSFTRRRVSVEDDVALVTKLHTELSSASESVMSTHIFSDNRLITVQIGEFLFFLFLKKNFYNLGTNLWRGISSAATVGLRQLSLFGLGVDDIASKTKVR